MSKIQKIDTVKKIILEIVSNELKNLSFIKTITHYYERNSFGQKGDRSIINIPEIKDEKLKWVFYQLLDTIDELLINNIQTDDFMQYEHWGLKESGLFGIFDIGFGNYFEEFSTEPENFELQNGEEYLPQVLRKIGVKKAHFLGGQMNGSAYEIGDNKILKITKDKTEAINCQKIKNKKMSHIADVYLVKQFTMNDRDYYVIVLEKLNTNQPFEKWYNELEKIFNNSINKHFESSIIKLIGKKNPEVSEFLNDMIVLGYEKTWEKWSDKLKDSDLINQYDWNDVSEISQWIKGSKDNNNDIEDTPPVYVVDLIKKLIS